MRSWPKQLSQEINLIREESDILGQNWEVTISLAEAIKGLYIGLN